MSRYHVTTFGCQMNEHDSERLKGMLESLGYSEAPARDQADLIGQHFSRDGGVFDGGAGQRNFLRLGLAEAQDAHFNSAAWITLQQDFSESPWYCFFCVVLFFVRKDRKEGYWKDRIDFPSLS